jgi:hypothetical protein
MESDFLSFFGNLWVGYAKLVAHADSNSPIPSPATPMLAGDVESVDAGPGHNSGSMPADSVPTDRAPTDQGSQEGIAGGVGRWGRAGALLWEAILSGPELGQAPEEAIPRRLAAGTAGEFRSPEDSILNILGQVGEAAPRELSARLRWSRSKTLRILNVLLEAKRVQRQGTTRSTTYQRSSTGRQAA